MDGYLYCANGKNCGEHKKRLTEEGFLVKIRPINLSKQQFEILVPSGELEEVQEVLNSIFDRSNLDSFLKQYCALRGVNT